MASFTKIKNAKMNRFRFFISCILHNNVLIKYFKTSIGTKILVINAVKKYFEFWTTSIMMSLNIFFNYFEQNNSQMSEFFVVDNYHSNYLDIIFLIRIIKIVNTEYPL